MIYGGKSPGPFALVVAPTKELADQIAKLAAHFLVPFPFLQMLNLAQYGDGFEPGQEVVDIVVTTPSK
jgi:superfamily II DNA/RNA helicase